MPVPYYLLKNLPTGLMQLGAAEPFRHALPQWHALGLRPVVDRVRGNGVLSDQGRHGQLLVVWPEWQEQPVPVPGVRDSGQTWHQIDDELSVGWEGETPPGPDDLDNGNPLALQTCGVILADGNVWQVPEIRDPGGTRLPTDLLRDRRTGALRRPLKREYEQLWQETEYWFDLRICNLTDGPQTYSLERALAFATQVLGLRYRFCDATQAALRVIDSTNVQTVIETAIGWPSVLQRIREIHGDEEDVSGQKKSPEPPAGNVSGSSGPGASGGITDRPAANSG